MADALLERCGSDLDLIAPGLFGELNAALSELQAPGLQAVEAASRANGIIQSIDTLQRERQTSALMQLSPSPLLPGSWAAATRDTVTLARGLGGEMSDRLEAATAADWYPGVLIALFVIASGVTLLQVAANPLVAELGSPKGASSRLNLSQAFNSLGTTVGPWLGSHVLLTGGVFAAGVWSRGPAFHLEPNSTVRAPAYRAACTNPAAG